ncbi:hypothetical protein AB3464_03055 [Pseudomonas asplenii]|uniref:hypothetical protein n=1 Tax=Pseudomonas asplenii TaxID=53407 RepID=UPI0037C827C8
MDVREVFEGGLIEELVSKGPLFKLTGWLVVIDGGLFVLEGGYVEPYEFSRKIKISNFEIAYAVRDYVYPLGGRGSFLFHQVEVLGRLIEKLIPVMVVDAMSILEGAGYISVDVSLDKIEGCKKKYGVNFMKAEADTPDDWLDLYL